MNRHMTKLFRHARRRIRAAWLVAFTQDRGHIAVGLAIAIAAIGWVFPWSWPERAALVGLSGCAVAALGWTVIQRLPDPQVARALDRSLDTDDALVTSLQFAPTDPFGAAIHARAQSFADSDVTEAMRLPWRQRKVTLLAFLLVVLLAVIVVRNPQDESRDELAREQDRIDELATSLEADAQALRSSDNAASSELADQLLEAASALRAAENADDAADRLEQAQDDLLRTLDADALTQRGAVTGLERALDAEAFPGAASPVSASASDRLSTLAESVSQISEQERGQLASRLQALADAQATGSFDTAEALSEAAAAIDAGDLSAAEEALREASAAAASAAEVAAQTSAVADAAANAASAAAELRQPESGETADSGDGGQGQGGQGQGGQGDPGETPAGTNPNSSDGDGATNSGDADLPANAELELVGVDGANSGNGSGAAVEAPTPNQNDSAATQVDLEPFRAELARRTDDVVLATTNISDSDAATIAEYFNQLTDETP